MDKYSYINTCITCTFTYVYLQVIGVKRFVKASDDGLHQRHEQVLKKGGDSLLVLGDQLVEQWNELLDLLGLNQRKEKNMYIHTVTTHSERNNLSKL